MFFFIIVAAYLMPDLAWNGILFDLLLRRI